jgi:hypothetical protein
MSAGVFAGPERENNTARWITTRRLLVRSRDLAGAAMDGAPRCFPVNWLGVVVVRLEQGGPQHGTARDDRGRGFDIYPQETNETRWGQRMIHGVITMQNSELTGASISVVKQVSETVAICRWCGKENRVPLDGELPKCDCPGTTAVASVHTIAAAAPAGVPKESARRANLALEDVLGLLDAESARIERATGSQVTKSEMVRAMFRAFLADSKLTFGNCSSETDIQNVMGRYFVRVVEVVKAERARKPR